MGDSYGAGWSSGGGPGGPAGEAGPLGSSEASRPLPTRTSRRSGSGGAGGLGAAPSDDLRGVSPGSFGTLTAHDLGAIPSGPGLGTGTPGGGGLDGLASGGLGAVRTRRRRPMIVGLGGTTQPNSLTQWLLAGALGTMAQAGAETLLFGSGELDLPMYSPERPERGPGALRLLAAVEQCDALVIATAAQHGRVSGLVSNALDYLDDLRGAPRPHLDGRPVGLIVTAPGADSAGTALTALRSTVHSLRGWPTPQAILLDTSASPTIADADGRLTDQATASALETLVDQIMGFTYAWSQVI
ncbi:NAD(P)H-dependent oxidoreductase [Frankia sp. R82]|uniref:NADPH-dependent FMN reductase n=1 Tax=Frankia sp. R82 TaxID=2950553 RepID=UPI002044B09E|nr:NAD(P)H-dependent oxidoreductase [Frankia sp. R82]MCM3887052.1 NAD(P)H-dependent oxidoreductase [Frankia sp. R82]